MTSRSPVDRSITTSLARRQQRAIVAPVVRFLSTVAPTTLRTSRLETSTAAIVLPLTSPSRSRAMVSTSGSSGMPLKLAPTYVRAVLATVKFDQLGGRQAAPLGVANGGPQSRHRQHATARRDDSAFRPRSGACVKYDRVPQCRRNEDLVALGRTLRVTTRCEDGCHGGAVGDT